MHPMLYTLLQQFGKDIISAAPMVAEAARREVEVLRDPYIDKHAYWFRGGGEADIDADEHRRYDEMTPAQRVRLAEMQVAGELDRWNAAKTKHRRPWTGAWGAHMQMVAKERSPRADFRLGLVNFDEERPSGGLPRPEFPPGPLAADSGPASGIRRLPAGRADATSDAAPVVQQIGAVDGAVHGAQAPGQAQRTPLPDDPLRRRGDRRVAEAMAAMKERHRKAAEKEANRPRFRCSSCDHIFAGSRGTRVPCPHCRTLLDLPE